jgi:hypothetical protein
MSDGDDEHVCRICRCGGTEEQPLFYPCLCKGSIRFIHERCCLQWLQHSGKGQSCELCHAPLRFEAVYADHAPDDLSTLEFAVGLARRSSRWLLLLLRVVVSVALWLGALPLLTGLCFHWWVSELSGDMLPIHAHGAGLIIFCVPSALLLVSFGDLVMHFYRDAQVAAEAPAPPVPVQPIAPPVEPNVLAPAVAEHDDDDDDVVDADDDDDRDDDDDDDDDEAVPAVAAADVVAPALPAADAIAPAAPHGGRGGANEDVGVAVVPQNDLMARLAMDDDERVLFREFDFAIGMHGFGHAIVRVICIAMICMSVTIVALALPASVGRRALSAVHEIDVDAITEPLWKILLIGYACVVAGVTLLCCCIVGVEALAGANAFAAVAVLSALKVALVLLFELVLFPICFGYSLEFALLPATDGVWSERVELHRSWPWISLLLHWLVGIVYMYAFASALSWIRRSVRAGFLWFVRDPNDPAFDPVREISVRSLARHARRVVLSLCVYLFVMATVVSVPLAVLRALGVTPLALTGDTYGEHVMLINVFVPPAIRLYRVTTAARRTFLASMRVCGIALGLESYFFGLAPNEPAVGDDIVYAADPQQEQQRADAAADDEDDGHDDDNDNDDDDDDDDGFAVVQAPYRRPAWFVARIVAALCVMWMSVVAFVVVVFGAPLLLGRAVEAHSRGLARVPLLPTDLHRFLFGALLLGLVFRALTHVVRRVQVRRAQAAGDAGDAAEAAAEPLAPPARPADAQRRRGDLGKQVAWASKAAVVLGASALFRPILLGMALRAVVVDTLLPNSANMLTVVDDWLCGVMLETAIQMLSMMRRNDAVWLLPGEVAAQPLRDFAARVERYDLRWLAQDAVELVAFVAAFRAAGVAAGFAAAEFGATAVERVRVARLASAALPVARVVGWCLAANSAWLRRMHQSIRDDMYRIGVKLRNRDDAAAAVVQ